MSSLLARTGRHRQRYDHQLRLVAGCIPYRLVQNDEGCHSNSAKKLLVLMISTPNRDDLVFPKGGWEDDETIVEAANREAWEEAGVKGILDDKPLGDWVFRSKSRENSCSQEGGCRGYMFALKVTEEPDSWPEKAKYDRKWLTTEEAFKLCRYDWMQEALNKFLASLSEERTREESVDKFLTSLSEERTIGMREESVEVSTRAVPHAGEERQMSSSPGCFGKTPGIQHLDNSHSKCIVQG